MIFPFAILAKSESRTKLVSRALQKMSRNILVLKAILDFRIKNVEKEYFRVKQ
jgi:hypothetical protein